MPITKNAFLLFSSYPEAYTATGPILLKRTRVLIIISKKNEATLNSLVTEHKFPKCSLNSSLWTSEDSVMEFALLGGVNRDSWEGHKKLPTTKKFAVFKKKKFTTFFYPSTGWVVICLFTTNPQNNL